MKKFIIIIFLFSLSNVFSLEIDSVMFEKRIYNAIECIKNDSDFKLKYGNLTEKNVTFSLSDTVYQPFLKYNDILEIYSIPDSLIDLLQELDINIKQEIAKYIHFQNKEFIYKKIKFNPLGKYNDISTFTLGLAVYNKYPNIYEISIEKRNIDRESPILIYRILFDNNANIKKYKCNTLHISWVFPEMENDE